MRSETRPKKPEKAKVPVTMVKYMELPTRCSFPEVTMAVSNSTRATSTKFPQIQFPLPVPMGVIPMAANANEAKGRPFLRCASSHSCAASAELRYDTGLLTCSSISPSSRSILRAARRPRTAPPHFGCGAEFGGSDPRFRGSRHDPCAARPLFGCTSSGTTWGSR